MCCFVVPLGCEREMDIFNPEKQLALLEQTSMTRMIIVVLGRGHEYANLDQVKDELNAGVISLMPNDCVNASNIPYMSTSHIIHQRDVVFENNKVIVEDYKQQNDPEQEPQVLRQLIFPDLPTQIQSEIPLMYRNSKNTEIPANLMTQSALMPKKKQKEVIFDRDSLTYECHHAMISGLCLIAEKLCAQIKDAELDKKLNILVLGTGVGVLPMFLKQHFSKYLAKVTTVEIDAGVLLAARDHFGFFVENEPLINSVCADAYEWVLEADPASNQFDLVFMDINKEEGDDKINPPIKFFGQDFMSKLQELTTAEGSLIAFNVIVDGDSNRRKVVQALKAQPNCVKYSSGMQEDLNEVFYLAKGTFNKQAEDKLDETENRMQKMGQIINSLKLPRAILQKMQVNYHVDAMRKI